MSQALPFATREYSQDQTQRTLAAIEQRLAALERAAATGYQITNAPSILRTLDGVSGSTGNVLQVLCTLISDLKNKGMLSK